jgi:hypothetical protein
MGVQVSYLVNSFPGFHSNGECAVCHNEPLTAYNSSYANSQITLDGNMDEDFWSGEDIGSQLRLPVGTTFGGVHAFISVTFAQNSTHLFTVIEWEDYNITGSDSQRYSAADGISVMWNVNMDNMDDAYFSGMKTQNAGEIVDVWVWKPTAAETGLESGVNTTAEEKISLTGNIYDTSFDDGGWADGDEATEDVMTGASWGFQAEHAENNYVVEFARPLVTGDARDIQFDKIGYFDFALAWYNASSGSSHAVSFQHSVWVQGVCTGAACYDPLYVETTTMTETADPVTETETSVSTESPISPVWIIMGLFAVGIPVFFNRRK